ncbi:MAG: hypothetical protein KDC03_08405, partial [Flavobacteriales bacterium]|nr:hypothetical protein [Flavobacteriales bacterium]
TSMAHGLEVRPPFLDRRVVELAFGLPDRLKLERGKGKVLLKRIFQDLLPASVVHRRKQGFEVPLTALFNGPLASLVNDLLRDDLVEAAGLSAKGVKHIVERTRKGRTSAGQATVHALVVYLSWWKRRQV